jgi:biotin operon repressor
MEELFNESNGVILKRKDMFVQVPIEFICNPEYKDKSKLLYIYFWSYGITDKRGSYPSHQRIGNDLGWSKSTVIRALKTLQEEGGVYIVNRFMKTDKGTLEKTSNLYYLAELERGLFKYDKNILDILNMRYPNNTEEIERPLKQSRKHS